MWDIGNETAVGAVRQGTTVKACQWTLSPQGPVPVMLPDPDHTIARCVSPNGKHIARWKHREEVQPIAISDTGVIRRRSDIPTVTLFAANADGIAVGESGGYPCIVRGTPHLISSLQGKKGCVTSINDFGRVAGWYQPDEPGSHPVAFTAVLPKKE